MKFTYYMPTRLVVGRNCLQEHRALLGGLGRKAFVMTGGQSAHKNGALADLSAALEAEGIPWKHYPEVKPNPSLPEVRDAAGQARSFGADFVVAIGGGSPMDAAKAVAVLAAEEVSDQALLGQRRFARVLPLAVVPTTSGTGSEVTPYSILTNDSLQTKSFLNSEQVYPAVAFLDGRYTLELPAHITSATVVDALSHALEGYLSARATPLAQTLALDSLARIGSLLPAMTQGRLLDLSMRETLLYASTLAGMVIAQTGTTAVHAMGYSLTYFKGIDHGVANGILLGRYLRFLFPSRPTEVMKILNTLGFTGIAEFEESLAILVGRVQLEDSEIEQFSRIAIQAGNIVNTLPRPSQEDLAEMYRDCCGKRGSL